MKKTNNDSITNQTSLYQFSILSSFLSFRKKKFSKRLEVIIDQIHRATSLKNRQ